VSGLIISCGSSNNSNSSKGEQDEKDQWTQEEKELIEKLKKQVKPAKWESFEKKSIKKCKDDKQEIEKRIKDCTDALQTASRLEKGKKVSDEDNGLNFLKNGLEILEGINRTIANDIPILKQFFTNLLDLYQNFKKQAELTQ
jgi:hypothetical protein